MKEFKLTEEEKQECRNGAYYDSLEDKEIIIPPPNSLDELIENLQTAREHILWDLPNIDVDEISWRYYEDPDPYEDWKYPTIKLFWSKPRNSDKEYDKLETQMLKEKRRKYENYLMLKKEFEDED